MNLSPSHVAILVPSLERAADHLRQFEFDIGEVDDFEETREIYVQGSERNSLLLMEAKKTGSYRKALEKRGPGLHHMAIDVLNLEEFLSSLSGSGWLLHLNSLKSIPDYRTAYLARPGFPALIEVQEKRELGKGPLFVERVSLKLSREQGKLVDALGLGNILKPAAGNPEISVQGKTVVLETLF